jgi:hypothetical protein
LLLFKIVKNYFQLSCIEHELEIKIEFDSVGWDSIDHCLTTYCFMQYIVAVSSGQFKFSWRWGCLGTRVVNRKS